MAWTAARLALPVPAFAFKPEGPSCSSSHAWKVLARRFKVPPGSGDSQEVDPPRPLPTSGS
eukprot:789789-Prorocentrum_lima.AAC.1